MGEQTHLGLREQVDLGSFYTPPFLVQKVYELLSPYIHPEEYVLLDSSCGYGSFLGTTLSQGFADIIGVDIDKGAIQKAREIIQDSKVALFHQNALSNISRKKFHIAESAKLIIVGNPPYNDKTSIVRNTLKSTCKSPQRDQIDSNLKARDLGISFLRSYERLRADFVCVLHPLSYLIKPSNFKALKDFSARYMLLDSVVVSSEVFCPKSIGHFPIIIALYARISLESMQAMDFDFIQNYHFRTLEGKSFRLSDFDFIGRYIDKYPNKNRVADSQKVAMFYTLRDINALRRSKTFLDKQSTNAVYVSAQNYSLYCYVDVFKRYISHVPYYLGNCDIIIDYAKFQNLESIFVDFSEEARGLRTLSRVQKTRVDSKIARYFKELLGEHYED